MIIILSPSKTKDFSKKSEYTNNLFENKTKELKNILNSMKKEDIEKILKYKKIDELDYLENIKNKCIDTYNGLVFKNLDVRQNINKLYILSAYYGILRATDGISNYRLDMNNNIVKGKYKNMYTFWNDTYNYFINEDFVLNLASKEYSKMINPQNMINIEFYTLNKGEYKILSTKSKIMRGKFTSFILNNNINSIDEIKKITLDNFEFDSNESDEKNLKFYERIN